MYMSKNHHKRQKSGQYYPVSVRSSDFGEFYRDD